MLRILIVTTTTHTHLIINVNNTSYEQIVFGRNSIMQK